MKKIMNVKKVVCPIDFSDNSKLIAESAAYIAGTFKAEIHFVYIVQSFEDYSGFFVPQMAMPNLESELFSGAEEHLAHFCTEYEESFKQAGAALVAHRVFVGDVAEKIVDYADEIAADLIIMGTHGYKGIEKIMFGSIADKVVRSAYCPVMTINPYTCCDVPRKE
jgi:nucleotide-binding universal stress UspA family protein